MATYKIPIDTDYLEKLINDRLCCEHCGERSATYILKVTDVQLDLFKFIQSSILLCPACLEEVKLCYQYEDMGGIYYE